MSIKETWFKLCCIAKRLTTLEATVAAGGGGGGGGGDVPEWVTDLDEEGISINGDDELEIVKDGVTFWIPLNRR